MANSKQAAKRARQAEKHRQHNKALRSRMRTSIKNLYKVIETGDHTAAMEAFRKVQSEVDTMATKGIIHKNKAARLKSRLNAKVKALAS